MKIIKQRWCRSRQRGKKTHTQTHSSHQLSTLIVTYSLTKLCKTIVPNPSCGIAMNALEGWVDTWDKEITED